MKIRGGNFQHGGGDIIFPTYGRSRLQSDTFVAMGTCIGNTSLLSTKKTNCYLDIPP